MVDNTARYHRQIILPEIGPGGQARLTAARVLVVGAGGLGCPALQYLAGAGIGTIGIIDHDRVDITNLHRQILFSMDDAGKSKAQVARNNILALNPDITVHAYDFELTDKNSAGLFSGYDIIVDGTDNFAAKYLINDVAVKMGKPVVYAAIQGFDGQVAIFDAVHGPCYRCLFSQPPRGIILNCAEAGVVGALAGIVGTAQAMEVIKLVVGHESLKPLRGSLWTIDSRTMETRLLTIPKRKDCPVCSRPPAEIVLQYTSPVCTLEGVREISCSDISFRESLMIDVREKDEWDKGYIDGACHIPLSAIKQNPEIFSPYREQSCILYCQRGMRSRMAVEILLAAGFSDLYSLAGGYEQWLATRS
ncbi:MAG: ThiF family adenylyltransferase [Micavibrio sp.]